MNVGAARCKITANSGGGPPLIPTNLRVASAASSDDIVRRFSYNFGYSSSVRVQMIGWLFSYKGDMDTG